MTKEGMNHTYTDAEIDAAILRGAEVVGEEVRKGLGLPLESATDPVAVSAAEEAAPVKPAAVDVASKAKPAVAESVPKTGKPGVGKKARRHFKDDKSTVVTSATGAGRHRGGRVGNKVAKKVSEKIAAETGADKVVEGKKAEEASVAAGFPEGGVLRDSVYESRMSVPYPIDDIERQLAGIQLQTNEDGASGAVETNDGIPVLTDVVKETGALADPAVLVAQADEAARARLEQIQEEGGSIERPAVEVTPAVESVQVAEAVPDIEAVPVAENRIKKLREAVAEARARYAKQQYEHSRLTERLKRSPIGRFLNGNDNDTSDLEYWRLEYEEKLAALREAELEDIKESGLKGQALKEAMAGLLRASKVDEVLALMDDRDAYQLEGKQLTDKVYNAFRSVAEGYNKLSPKYKVMTGIAVSALALGSAGMGAAYLTMGAKLARRFVSSAGFAVAIDAGLDAKMIEHLKQQAEERIKAELAEIFGPADVSLEGDAPIERTEEEMLGMFGERLKVASGEADPVFQNLLKERYWNGWKGAAAGTIAGFAGSAAAEWYKESGDMISGAAPEEVPAIEQSLSHPDGIGVSVENPGVPAADILSQEEIDARETENMREAAKYEAIQEMKEAEVTEVIPGDPAKIEGAMVHDRAEFVSEESVESGDVQPEAVFAPELQPRVDGWFDQIFRVDGEMPGSGRDWVLDREKLANTKISDMIRDAVLYQKGEVSGFRTNLSAEQLKNFAQFFQHAGTGIGDQKAMAGIIYDTMRNKDMTVADYLEKVAPLAKQGQRFGLFTTSV